MVYLVQLLTNSTEKVVSGLVYIDGKPAGSFTMPRFLLAILEESGEVDVMGGRESL